MWPRIPSGSVAPMFYLQLFALFCDKNHRFLLQNHEVVDETSEQYFAKQFKATHKISSESDLKCTWLAGCGYALSPSIWI